MLEYLHDKPEEQDVGHIAEPVEVVEGAPDRLELELFRPSYEAIVVADKRAALQDTLH
jgi:hypothetical protein